MAKKKATHGESFWTGIIAVFAIAIGTLVLDWLGVFIYFETGRLDNFQILGQRQPPRFVRVVAITESDYHRTDLFNATSPLAAKPMIRLIKAVASEKPALIVVDVDTASKDWIDAVHQLPQEVASQIIWAQDALPLEDNSSPGLVNPLPVLGRTQILPNGGLTLFPLDWDSKIRRHQRFFDSALGAINSLSWTAALRYVSLNPETISSEEKIAILKSGEERVISLNIPGARYSHQQISASDVIFISDQKRISGPLTGKIAVIGGTYREGTNVRQTPSGERFGVELVAQTIEAELRDHRLRHIGKILVFISDVSIGLIIIALYRYLPPRYAIFVGFFGGPLLLFAGSIASFASAAYWFEFLPMYVGMTVHQLSHVFQIRPHHPRHQDTPTA